MKQYSCYSVKIKHYNRIFQETVLMYREAVTFFIRVCLSEWNTLSAIDGNHEKQVFVEHLCHRTKKNPEVKYPSFDKQFYKFPSYLRRSAISEAIGKVSSYYSTLKNWETADKKSRGRQPSLPNAGMVYPCMYRDNMYLQTGTYEVQVKVYIRNTWDWLTVSPRKSDMDYILHHCAARKACAPTLHKRGREWFLDFPFESSLSLHQAPVHEQTIAAVDLGLNSSACVSVMRMDGTILGRHFLRLSKEYDSLMHAVNRIKKAQQYGNRKTPRLWAKANGINDDIAVKTAAFVMDVAVSYDADTIVFEHLDLNGRKHGSKKQKLHLWKSRYVQSIVTDKAHCLGMRISRICAWGTSRLAFDGSGTVLRGRDGNLPTYSLCRFSNGKVYHCDLSASYNIGARYFIREILKSLPAKARLAVEANVPQLAKRSTCTCSSLISLNAELAIL